MAAAQGAFYAALGARLGDARRRARITQDQLAHVIGLSRTSVTNIENGRQPVQIHLLVRIAGAVGSSVQKLLPPATKGVAGRFGARTPNVRPGKGKSNEGPKPVSKR